MKMLYIKTNRTFTAEELLEIFRTEGRFTRDICGFTNEDIKLHKFGKTDGLLFPEVGHFINRVQTGKNAVYVDMDYKKKSGWWFAFIFSLISYFVTMKSRKRNKPILAHIKAEAKRLMENRV